jgi:hypothetical protein
VKAGIDAWTGAAGITSGVLLRSINIAGRIWGTGFSPKVIWGVVKQKAKSCEIPFLAPHDLRRTCARLCHQAGGELEEGHLLADHVHMMMSIPPKYAVSQVVGFIKGKSAIHLGMENGNRTTLGKASGRGGTLCRP